MPSNLHPAKWGPADRTWDPFIENLIRERGFGVEREYVGIVSRERAEQIRRGMKTAGRHLKVAVKSFWRPCPGCDAGGPECCFHVSFTAYDPEVARQYKARQAQTS